MVLLNLRILRRLSELVSSAAGASNVSCWTDDNDPFLIAKHTHTLYIVTCLFRF